METAISLGSLAFSVLALAAAAFCVLRGAPAQLEAHAREALQLAHSTALKYTAFESEAQSVLGAVQEERERTIRAQRRISADRNRVDAAEGNAGSVPQTRDEQLAQLRRQVGLI